MKKKFLLLVIILLLIPTKVLGLTYTSSLSGDNTIFAKSDSEALNMRARTSMFIDVSNLENISYLELYVSYDNNLVGLSTCNSFNFIGGGCTITSDKKVFHDYRGVSSYVNQYHFYTVTFMYKDKTPKSGTTTVNVSFKNAKDLDGNSISISPSSKIYNFSESYMKMPTTTTEKSDYSSDNKYTSEKTTKKLSDTKNVDNNTSTNINTKKSKSEKDDSSTKSLSSAIEKNEINDNKQKSIKSNKDEKDDDKPKFKITKKIINTAIIIGLIVLVISCIFIVVSHKKNKRLDKMLNDFDKF